MNPLVPPPPQRTTPNRGVVYRSLALPMSQMDMSNERKYGTTQSKVGEMVTTSKGEALWGSSANASTAGAQKIQPSTLDSVRLSFPPSSSGIVSESSVVIRNVTSEVLNKLETHITTLLTQAQPVVQFKHVPDKWKWKCQSCSPQHVCTTFDVRLFSATTPNASNQDLILVECTRMSGDQYYFDYIFSTFREGLKTCGYAVLCRYSMNGNQPQTNTSASTSTTTTTTNRTPRAFVPPPLPVEFVITTDSDGELFKNDCTILQSNCNSNFIEVQTEAFQCLAVKLDTSSGMLGAVSSSNEFLNVISNVVCSSHDANVVRLACNCVCILANANVNAKTYFTNNVSLRNTLTSISNNNNNVSDLITIECKAKAKDALHALMI
jgi:hypothetical protein